MEASGIMWKNQNMKRFPANLFKGSKVLDTTLK
jgi:hypothetical protein